MDYPNPFSQIQYSSHSTIRDSAYDQRVTNSKIKRELACQGYSILEYAVFTDELEAAKRLLNLEIVNWGLTKEQFDEWHQNKTWFPTLRWKKEILDLATFIPKSFTFEQDMCEPQILCHFPDEATEWDFEYHLDQEPEWANGRKYSLIAGVALTENYFANGGLVILPPFGKEEKDSIPVAMDAGDIILMDPRLRHRSGLNQTGDVRMMVYFRFLEPDERS
jgi:hypothetical protein